MINCLLLLLLLLLSTGTSRQETAKRCGEDGRPVSDDEDDSFIFIDTIGRKELFHLRVTLKPFQGGETSALTD